MGKLTRKAHILMFAFMLCLIFVFGYFMIKDSNVEEEKPKDEYSIKVVLEDEKILSTYIDSISPQTSQKAYKTYSIVVPKGTKIKDYTLSQEQTYNKYLLLQGPNGKDVLTKKSKQVISHYAYSMLLVGDVIEKTHLDTKEKTYEIVNARITYDQIPMVLLSNENSVCLRNKKQTKEKVIILQDFINALKDVKKRDEMISW